METVNLDKLASVFANRAKRPTNYKRLQRCFRDFVVNSDEIARVVVKWSAIPELWTLRLDRTNWSLGRTDVQC